MKTDAQIQADVTNELKWEPRVSHQEIGVAVHHGVVTLNGHVPTYAEKWAAEKAAMRVRGVRGIAEEIEVRIETPHKRDDTEIAEAVANTINWHVWTPDNIKTKVEKGWVTLSGEVKFDFQRKSAADSVRFLAGVRGVTNGIQVKARGKAENIKREIEEALVRDAELEAEHIRVKTDGGTVTLSGDVHSFFEKQAAANAAWRAGGVNSVQNNIHVS